MPSSHSTLRQNSLFVVNVWNSLLVEMYHTSKTHFKCKIHNLLLQKFSEADDYTDLPDLIKTENILKTQCIIFA